MIFTYPRPTRVIQRFIRNHRAGRQLYSDPVAAVTLTQLNIIRFHSNHLVKKMAVAETGANSLSKLADQD